MMRLDNVVIELEYPQNIDISDLRKFIINNLPKEVEIIRWYIDDVKILNKKARKKLMRICVSTLN